jgi:site-specific DNA-methyltransferase (adenine-specific)
MFSIIQSDALQYLITMEDNSVDCVLTDPPYGLDYMNDKWDNENIEKLIKKAEKSPIKKIPVGMKFNKESAINVAEFLKPIVTELYRILKPGSFCLVMSQARSSHRIGIMLEDCGFEMRDQLIWDYGAGQGKAQSMNNFIRKNKSLTDEEKIKYINLLDGFKTPQLTPAFETIWLGQKPKDNVFWKNYITHGVGLVDMSSGSVSVRFKHKKPSANERLEGGNHPTQKPISLFSDLVNTFTKEGDLVLDCFSGSGTTGVACMTAGRKFIGIDKDEKYVNIANKRIKET